jgi:uncharacterized membrane protein YbhN (UPF0104 family)
MRTDPANADRKPGSDTGTSGTWLSWWRGWRTWLPFLIKPLRRGIVLFVIALVIEYLVVPELVGASKDLSLLGRVNVGWLVAGLVTECLSLFCYGLLTRAVLSPPGPDDPPRPGLSRLFRIDLAAAAIAHVIPAGTLGSAGIGYRLFTAEGIKGNDAAVMMATKGLGSTVVLNVLLWLSLVVSIPLAGFHPIYVTVAVIGAVLLFAIAALAFGITRGVGRASRILHAVGNRIPGLTGERLEQGLREAGASLSALARDRRTLGLAQLAAGCRVAVVLRGRLRPFRQSGRAVRRLRDRQHSGRPAHHACRAWRRRFGGSVAAGQLRRHPKRGHARRPGLAASELLAAHPGRRRRVRIPQGAAGIGPESHARRRGHHDFARRSAP